MFPAPREYGEESLREALEYLAGTEADLGGTELLPALRHLLSQPPAEGHRREVIVLTDGEVGNEAEVHALVRRHRADTRFFAVGIGMGPNEHLVRGLARAGGGACEFIHPGERIEPKMLRLFQKLAARRFDGVRVRAGGGQPQPVPSAAVLLPGSPATLFARCEAACAGGEVTVSGRADPAADGRGEELRWVLPVTDVEGEQVPVPLLWARERIRELEETEGGAPAEVARLSVEYGLLSGSASFVAVEERAEADRTRGEVPLRRVPVLVTADWHGGAAGAAPPPLRAVASRQVGPASGLRLPLVGGRDRAGGRVVAKLGFFGSAAPAPRLASFRAAPAGPAAGRAAGAPGPAKRGKGEERTDLLLALLQLQEAEGGFEPDPPILRRLGLDPLELERAARGLEGAGGADPARLLGTALVLQVLGTIFAAERPTWAGLVAKSGAWLDGRNAGGAGRRPEGRRAGPRRLGGGAGRQGPPAFLTRRPARSSPRPARRATLDRP